MGKGGDGGGENMALWLLGVDNLKIQPLKLPPLGPNDVLVRMKAVGICGTDVHYLKHMMMTRYVVKEPMVLGHECAGIIEELGSEVKNLAVGDRVALDPGLACENCNHCKDGRQNLCEGTKCLGLPPDHGGLANKVVHPAHLCYKLPDNVSLEEGAVCEPLSVAVHACRRAKINSKSNALIVGAGTMGLLTMFTARAYGAQRIIVVDVDDRRISVAKSLGADEVLKVSTSVDDVDKEVELIQKMMGCDIDVTFDCAGFSKTMATALIATRTGGIVCLVGMGHNHLTIPLTSAVAAREVDILGAFRYIPNTWPQCIEFLASGKIDVKPLITHRFGLNQEDVQKAFEASAGGGNAIKVMFTL